MTQLNVHTIDGKKKGTIEVSDAFFAAPSNPVLLHQVVVAYAANRRQSTAHTKNRGERSGSGRKPWKQKGTGNARTGSIRNPIWRGGGVVFGPRSERNFTKKTTLKMRRKAMAVALSEKVRADQLFIVENFAFGETKTKNMAKALEALMIAGKSCVIVLSEKERAVALTARNIPRVRSRSLKTINAYDMINHAIVLMSKDAVKELEARLAGDVKESVTA